jgi:hypothetical protein
VIKKDIIPQMRKDPGYLARMKIRIIDGTGTEIDPARIDWKTERAANYILRQDPGVDNSLGEIRFDMPNKHAVYMHDTPSKRLFARNARFLSSGCVRVAGVRDLAAWLLEGTSSPGTEPPARAAPGTPPAPPVVMASPVAPAAGAAPGALNWGPAEIAAAISSAQRRDVRLVKAVPVAWVYLTGYATPDGIVHFREDIYGLDTPAATPAVAAAPAPAATPVQPPAASAQPPAGGQASREVTRTRSSPRLSDANPEPRPSRAGRGLGQHARGREKDLGHGPVRGRGEKAERAVIELDQRPGERQFEARFSGIDLPFKAERFERSLPLERCQTRSGIAHPQRDVAAIGHGRRDDHLSAHARDAERVRHEQRHGPLESGAVGNQGRQVRRETRPQDDAVAGGRRVHGLDAICREPVQIDARERQVDLARDGPREGAEVVEQVDELGAGVVDLRQVGCMALVRDAAEPLLHHQRGKAHHAAQRRA